MLSQSVNETSSYAMELAKTLKPGSIICLEGDLGVGKTVFVQGLAKGLGISEYICSPTFNIVNTYIGEKKLHHFDAYRIADPDEMLDIGFDEYINDDAIVVIEWASMIKDIIPNDALWITINRVSNNDNHREIIVRNEYFSN